jgi:urease accessory protein
MTKTAALLGLMQINDSAFPSGAFVHSYGLEQLVRERHISDARELEGFVTSVLHQSLSTADARAAFTAAHAQDIATVAALDEALFATKAASELRAACVSTGRRFLEETAQAACLEWGSQYRQLVRARTAPGCYPVAFGVVCQELGVEPADVPGAFLLNAITAILQSALRLMRVSHRDMQTALHALRPQIAAITEEIISRGHRPSMPILRAFNPMQDIASMRHERAETRLFAS